MADNLTPQQAQAVRDRGGKLLVSAAAGSGKTKVLVDRLLSYLTDPNDPAELDDFLIITYTKAAASELRGKIAAKLTERIAQEPENRHLQKQMQRLYLTQISTVHSFCTNILREYAYHLDLSADFRVADESECAELRETVLKDLLDRTYENLEENPGFTAFVDSQGVGRNDNQIPEIVQKVYDSARCHKDPEQWLNQCLENAAPEAGTDASQTVWGEFLMEKILFPYLDGQIHAVEKCCVSMAEYPELDKPRANIETLLAQLRDLRASETWDQVIQRKDIDYGRLTFASKKNPDPALAEEVKAVRNGCKEGLAKKLRSFSNSSSQIVADLRQCGDAAEGLVSFVRQFDRDFRQAKRSRRILDFGDLEHKTLDLLLGRDHNTPTAAAREIGKRFREIMVDEYQDSNEVQDAIFSVLTEQKQNCFMVGDVKQSIYRFRLADPQIFLEKYENYADAAQAEAGQGRRVLLSHNFRSGPEVIEGINDVFQTCMSKRVGGLDYGEAEALREGVPHQPLPDPAVELYALETEEDAYAEEASFAAGQIRAMLDQGTLVREGDRFRPVRPEDIVILLRSPGSVGGAFQKALEAVGIRCAINGGMDLLHTPEVNTLRSFLQTIANPRQDIPLLGALAGPVFGFTADDLAAFRGRHRRGCIFDALEGSSLPKARHFLQILEQLRKEASMSTLTELLERCFLLTRLDSVYGAMPGGAARKANLQMFFQLAVDYEKTGLRSLNQFLDYLDSLEDSGLQAAQSSNAGCVTIMSIHKSKGLEFPVVFLCNLSRRFNRESQQEQVLCDQKLGLGLAVADTQNRIRYSSLSKRAIAASMDAENISEEMRVLYVAMTRARDRLVMTYAHQSLEKKICNLAMRLPYDDGQLLYSEVSCPGDWVLAAALQRTEAGELHALGARPRETHISQYPWRIRVVQSVMPQEQHTAVSEAPAARQTIDLTPIRDALAFSYPYPAATLAPSKQTATGRKGRIRDEEVLEHSREPETRIRAWRKPSFRMKQKDGRTVGNAFHSAMQFIRYEACKDQNGVEQEVRRMVEQGLLSEEQGKLVNCRKIASFFESDLGVLLRSGVPYVREFKFSILDNAANYGDGLEADRVLLQGVVDCAILEEDGIVLLDFKTDHVSRETIGTAVERYRIQLETYADALARIYEKPVKQKYLYFFHLDQIVSL